MLMLVVAVGSHLIYYIYNIYFYDFGLSKLQILLSLVTITVIKNFGPPFLFFGQIYVTAVKEVLLQKATAAYC